MIWTCDVIENCVPPKTQRLRKAATVASVLSCVVISSCYWLQPDWLAPVILVPPWCWLILGLLLAVCGYRRGHKLRFTAMLALWCLFISSFVEEAYSLIRISRRPTVAWREARERGDVIRVVSLNCDVGQVRSVEEIGRWKPDIVLLQESPSSDQLERLSKTLFGAAGGFIHGGDVSILSPGQIQPKFANRASHFVHAELTLPNGLSTQVISLHLAPPVFRLDFWTRDFWIDHRDKRIEHREQISDIMEHVQGIPASSHLIVGGDFNSPPYDDTAAPLEHRLFDTFQKAGRGWGSTGTNEYPFFRVDQIWVSPTFRAESVTAQKTLYSDHRTVVCDLILQ